MPADASITSQFIAELDYFDSDHPQSRKKGSIDLSRCDEVIQNMVSQQYPHVFGLKTRHHGRERIYYLAAESEAEMTKWAATLCRVLHLDCQCELCSLPVGNVNLQNVYNRDVRQLSN